MGLKKVLDALRPALRNAAGMFSDARARIKAKLREERSINAELRAKAATRAEVEAAARKAVADYRAPLRDALAPNVSSMLCGSVVEDPTIKAGYRALPPRALGDIILDVHIRGFDQPARWAALANPEGMIAALLEASDRGPQYGDPLKDRLPALQASDARIAALLQEDRDLCVLAAEHGLTLEPLPENAAADAMNAAREARQKAAHARHIAANSRAISRLEAEAEARERARQAQEELERKNAEQAAKEAAERAARESQA
jgi:hypothetical protein